MDNPSLKPISESRSQQRKYQYFTGSASTNQTNLTTSSIDQHRNSIQQRIANLQAKISKKYTPQMDSLVTSPQTQSDSYVNTRRMYRYPPPSSETRNAYVPPVSQPHFQALYSNKDTPQLGYSQAKQQSLKGSYRYLTNGQTIDQKALREKYQYNAVGSNQLGSNKNMKVRQPSYHEKNHDRAIQNMYGSQNQNHSKDRLVGKTIKNVLQENKPHQRPQQNTRKAYPSSQKSTQQNPHQPDFSLSNPTLKPHHLQDNINQLNKTISNLKAYTGLSSMMGSDSVPMKGRTISYETGSGGGVSNNNQLFQMMRSVLMGQERLEKELAILKSKGAKQQVKEQFINRNMIETYQHLGRQKPHSPIGQKAYHNQPSDLKLKHLIKQNQQEPSKSAKKQQKNTSRSPQPSRKSKSPKLSKSPQNQKSNRPTPTKTQPAIKRNRATSAMNPAKKPVGKIAKNKEKFYQLYKQAQTTKRLSPGNARITVSSNVVSSVWDKIKSAIQRSSADDAEASVIYHENNKYLNDHLVNSIELQKKLKNDLVKKVYDMCENKCLFK